MWQRDGPKCCHNSQDLVTFKVLKSTIVRKLRCDLCRCGLLVQFATLLELVNSRSDHYKDVGVGRSVTRRTETLQFKPVRPRRRKILHQNVSCVMFILQHMVNLRPSTQFVGILVLQQIFLQSLMNPMITTPSSWEISWGPSLVDLRGSQNQGSIFYLNLQDLSPSTCWSQEFRQNLMSHASIVFKASRPRKLHASKLHSTLCHF